MGNSTDGATTRARAGAQAGRAPAPAETIALLLDYAPQTWCSREDHHLLLARELTAIGARPVLVFAKALPEELAAPLRECGAEVTAIDYGEGAGRYYRELRKVVAQYSVTAVHICYFDYFSALAWIARLCGVRAIIYEAVNSGEFRAASWKGLLLRLRTHLTTRPLKRVIAISEFVKRQLIKGGLPDGRAVVRYLGVDVQKFSPDAEARRRLVEEYQIGPEEVIVSTVSFLNPFKNPQTIVEACALLAQRGVTVRLFVAGDGPLRGELEALGRATGIADRVHWLGHCADPRTLLQGSDIFALASVGEAFGLVLPEAMACGLPVVATRSGGIVEIVEDGRTGLLVPPLDPRAFADALGRLAADPQLRRTMGADGLERVKQSFTVEAAVDNTMKVYRSLGMVGANSFGRRRSV